MLVFGFIEDESGFLKYRKYIIFYEKIDEGLIKKVAFTQTIDLVFYKACMINSSELRRMSLYKKRILKNKNASKRSKNENIFLMEKTFLGI